MSNPSFSQIPASRSLRLLFLLFGILFSAGFHESFAAGRFLADPVLSEFGKTNIHLFTPPVVVSAPTAFQVTPGTFNVPITVDDVTGDEINSFQFELVFDPDVIVPNGTNYGCSTAGTMAAGYSVACNVSPAGHLLVSVSNTSAGTLSGSGTILNIGFTTHGSAVVGDISPLTFTANSVKFFNESLQVVPSTPVNGQITLVKDYTITVTQSANGTIVPGTTIVPYGTNQTFTITPVANHNVADIIVDNVSKGPDTTYTFLNVIADHTITAIFAINTFPITATSGANGTVTPTGTTSVPFGGNQTYTITPGPNYLIDDVLVDGQSVGAVAIHTFDNVTGPHTISATFKIKRFALTVSKTGNGQGTVASSTAGIDCGVDCSEIYDINTEVTLTATPATGSTFTGWTGACSGTGTCVVTVSEAKAVAANFSLQTYALNVVKAGNGTGTVTSSTAGIDCGTDCDETYNYGTVVTLTAAPATGSTFTGWTGACSGTGTCVVTIDALKTATATFTLQTFALNVTKAGNGSGTVTSSTAGIDCGSDCTETYNYGAVVTLAATPATGSTFTGWSGACTGTGICVVTIDALKSVTAAFTLQTFALNVTKAGNGTGTVTSSSAGIDCGADCTETYNYGTVVTLTAVPASNTNFAGWSGACTGSGTCVVTMDAVKLATATFTLKTFALDVAKTGTGTGTVTSVPSGIDCGPDCTETYNIGTVVTLTATPTASSDFAGWSGGCTGTGTCVVTMNAAAAVTATFTLKTLPFNVVKAGNGFGSVNSAAAGIDCGTDCAETYNYGTVVTLTATPNIGSNFTGWSGGGCSGTGTCVVTVTAATSVTATFTLQTFSLQVNRTGTGTGSVSSSPVGVICGSDCFEIYDYGTVVTLTATPNVDSTFTGWNGSCPGTGTCQVTMTSNRTVNAAFAVKTFPMNVTLAGNGVGLITSSPSGINCGADCTETYNFGTLVTLTAAPNANSIFTGWGGACTGTSTTCVVNMTAAAAVTATFTLKTFELTVIRSGTGEGSVSSSQPGINCGTDCTETYNIGTAVTLTASPNAGTSFDGWSGGGCTGTGTCTVSMSAATTVTATFTRIVEILSVAKSGNGFGTITSTPAGINCTGNCSAPFPKNSQVTLTVTPNVGTNFTGWSGGGCTGTATTCVVTLNTATTVTANYVLQRFPLNVAKTGTGASNGTVVSTPVGINCGADCDQEFNFGDAIALNASTTPGTTFNGWSGGGCSGTGTCLVTVLRAETVTASFTIQTFTLSVGKSSNGSGIISSDTAGINCGADCAEVYNFGTVVTLTASPSPGSVFEGWSGGGCSGTGTCVVTMNQNVSGLTATFTLQIHSLIVIKDGNGTGTVTSSPSGINCGGDCSEPYNYGSIVTLTPAASANSDFAGWSGGGCSGTGTCVITIAEATSVTATFNLKTFSLDVNKDGNGTGTIISSPAGIDCGGDCTQVYNIATVVTLTAAPSSGSSFAGWSGGGCSGTGTCVVTMNAAASVTATFNTFPFVGFTSANFKGNESRTALITVNRTGDLSVTSTVIVSSSPGTATGAAVCGSGADYVELSQSLTFSPTVSVQTIPVSLCPDTDIDPFETINISLSSPVSANIGAQNTAVVEINDTANQYQGGLDEIFLFSSTNAEPYPSVVNTIDAPAGTVRVRVTLYDVWHSMPNNLKVLLVNPTGTKYVLMEAAGGNNPVVSNSPVTLTYADFQPQLVPSVGPLLTGAYKPTTCLTPVSNFVFPAPSGPYLEPGCQLSEGPILSGAFSGQELNGGWQLFLMDAGTGVPFTLAGSVTGGWGLELVPTTFPMVEVSGQVLTSSLLGLRNAVVSLTDSTGQKRSTPTNALGYFGFSEVAAGKTYILSVSSRRYRFESRVLHVADNIQNLELIGLE